MGIVDTTLSRVLEAYLEENPKHAKMMIQSNTGSTGQGRSKRARDMRTQKCISWWWFTGKLADRSDKDPGNANCSWWKEIPQAVRQNKAVTGVSGDLGSLRGKT